MINVAINGFGRIGRSFFRAVKQAGKQNDIRIVAINDLGSPEQLVHLLKYDSVLGRFGGDIALDNDKLIVDGSAIAVSSFRDLKDLPWKALDVDVVLESTGVFTDAEKARGHIEAGAKKVVISAPAKNDDLTLVYGVNHEQYQPDSHNIVSNASCTTNCLAPLMKVLDAELGIKRGMMTTVHAYTQDQNLQDGPHRDLRRARSAAQNIIPTSTGAAKAIGLVLPRLDGKLDGYSVRVPTITGSLVDCVIEVEKDTSTEDVNAFFQRAASAEMAGVIEYTDEPLVSSDVISNPASAVFDSQLTKVIGKRQVKVVAWYDNEWGFSNRLIDTITLVGGANSGV